MTFIPHEPLKLSKSERLRLFVKDVGLPLNKAPEALGLKSSEFLDWWSGHKGGIIRQKHFVQLAQYLHVNEDEILEGVYDKNLIREKIFGNELALPEKYRVNQFSRIVTSAHFFKYLTLTRGQHFSDMILRKMNVSPLIYNDLNNKMSLNYFMDLLEMLENHGLKQRELDHLAGMLFLGYDQTPMGQEFRRCKTYRDFYEVFAKTLPTLDSNFEYTAFVDRDKFFLRAFLPYDHHDQIAWKSESLMKNIQRLLRYRQILMGCFPLLSQMPPLFPEVTLTYSAHGITGEYQVQIPKDEEPNPLFSLVSY